MRQSNHPPVRVPHDLVVVPARTRLGVGRRTILRWAFWSSIGTALVAAGATVVNSLYPRGITGFGGPVVVPPASIPKPGADPVQIFDAHCLLVNLEPGEGRAVGDATPAPGGLLALWWKCPHLGCTVPWKPGFVYNDGSGRRGWFNCNCHGSTYTKAGVRVFGPAPRSMDTMEIDVGADGKITVQSGKRTSGDATNATRAVPYRKQAT
jgi:cytochrome b6-f complex iron-sulfur subunit